MTRHWYAGEAEAVMEALRGNLQTQLDALMQRSDQTNEQQVCPVAR